MRNRYAGMLIAISLLGCVDQSEDDSNADTRQHGRSGSSRVNALTDEQRETLCADSRQKILDVRGTDLEECTATAVARTGARNLTGVPGTQPPERSCPERVQECLAVPVSIRDPENAGGFPCTNSPLLGPWNDECTATVDAYDRCVDAIARYHDEHVGTISCEDVGADRPDVFVDIGECAALSGHCGVTVPTSLQ